MEQCDIKAWVERAPDKAQRELREAVHTALVAVARSSDLRPQMVMKGAILLALRYESTRYTRDIDFSTRQMFSQFNERDFLREFNKRLALAVEELDYELDCRIQSLKVKPRRDGASFQTLTLKIGYAYKGTKKHNHLMAGNCPDVIEIDYSFNELTEQIDRLQISDGTVVHIYSFTDLIAEKLRAILQQEDRDRVRRQDSYDLYRLMSRHPITGKERKKAVLDNLKSKAASRGLAIAADSMANPKIVERSKREYYQLQQEIDEKLPPFEKAYGIVQEFYESLPWPTDTR